jgi:hypothetical protein
MASHDLGNRTAKVNDQNAARHGKWAAGLIALAVIGLIGWIVWPDEDVSATGAIAPRPAAIEAPAAPGVRP